MCNWLPSPLWKDYFSEEDLESFIDKILLRVGFLFVVPSRGDFVKWTISRLFWIWNFSKRSRCYMGLLKALCFQVCSPQSVQRAFISAQCWTSERSTRPPVLLLHHVLSWQFLPTGSQCLSAHVTCSQRNRCPGPEPSSGRHPTLGCDKQMVFQVNSTFLSGS